MCDLIFIVREGGEIVDICKVYARKIATFGWGKKGLSLLVVHRFRGNREVRSMDTVDEPCFRTGGGGGGIKLWKNRKKGVVGPRHELALYK